MRVKAFIARDRDNELFIYFGKKPYKAKNEWSFYDGEHVSFAKIPDEDLFPDVKWDDEEPTEVSIELVGEKAQQPQEQLKSQTKFDTKMLKPFDKVLVRDCEYHKWTCNLFSHMSDNTLYKFQCFGFPYYYCIPYNDETKHLVGTTEEAPEYYRYWED